MHYPVNQCVNLTALVMYQSKGQLANSEPMEYCTVSSPQSTAIMQWKLNKNKNKAKFLHHTIKKMAISILHLHVILKLA